MTLKEKADNLMKIKGNVRGESLVSYKNYIKEKEGPEGVLKLKEIMESLGYPLDFEKIKALDWIQESYSALIMTILIENFDWKEEDIFNLGHNTPQHSFILKLLMKHFASIESILKEVPNTWNKYFDFGRLEAFDYNKEEKYIIIRLFDYHFNPLMCLYLSGYLLRIAKLSIKSEKITIEETKCTFNQDPHHEFVIKWE